MIIQSKRNINAWKCHLLHTANQDEFRLHILKQLDETSELIVLDWAMKFLHANFMEVKLTGLPNKGFHGIFAVAMKRGTDSQMHVMTFVHIFDSCNQDSHTILAILNNVFYRLKGAMVRI